VSIYILPVSEYLQPPSQGFMWPPGCDDYGVEQDFYRWLWGAGLVAGDRDQAGWCYLPIWWNRWYLTHPDEARQRNDDLQDHLDRALDGAAGKRVFTVCEYDPYFLQPGVNLHDLTVFTANRAQARGYDIPLLLHPHDLPPRRVDRLATFIGHLDTHPVRRKMQRALADCPGCYVTNEPHGIGAYMANMRSALVALAPRGDGAQSFRFYEAMQAGIVPLYLSDLDARPFQDRIDWQACSLYRDTPDGLCEYLHSFDTDELFAMGERASEVYHEQLRYGQWCRYVVDILEAL
jgi:hypothetical protein